MSLTFCGLRTPSTSVLLLLDFEPLHRVGAELMVQRVQQLRRLSLQQRLCVQVMRLDDVHRVILDDILLLEIEWIHTVPADCDGHRVVLHRWLHLLMRRRLVMQLNLLHVLLGMGYHDMLLLMVSLLLLLLLLLESWTEGLLVLLLLLLLLEREK